MSDSAISLLSTDELREELEKLLSTHFAGPRHIRRLRRRRSNYSSTYTIENLEIDLDHGRHLSLVFKNLSPGSLVEEAQRVRPEFLYNPHREIETYRCMLDAKTFGTPRCYGAVESVKHERYWLFLERVRGPLLWQVGRMEVWEHTARWAAALHSHYARTNGQRKTWPPALLQYNTDYCLRWVERAGNFLRTRPDARTAGWIDQFKRLAPVFERVVERMLSLPRTFIHGEFYPSNIILRRGSAKRVCPVDWEAAAIGPGLIDLAALVSGKWTEEQRKVLIRAYRDALEPAGDWPPSMDELLELVDYCQLYLAIQWLGWAGDWSPPKTHAQDWLSEAVRLSKRLGF